MHDPSNKFISIRGLAVALTAVGLCVRILPAAVPFYFGIWKIASAVVAPWAGAAPPDPSEMKSLVGKTVAIESKEIAGRGTLACKGPVYRVKYYPPDWLFQGAFAEMHVRGNAADAAELAGKLGFHGSSWKTLETGCANGIDFHFMEAATAAIGLNDYVYTLKKR
ncbi:MAG: hypothetical protein ABSG65_08235 [Bryobacteraceae bacterium]